MDEPDALARRPAAPRCGRSSYSEPPRAHAPQPDYSSKGSARGVHAVLCVARTDHAGQGRLRAQRHRARPQLRRAPVRGRHPVRAPNPSSALHKISEIYDRIAFAAVGRYNEYETLRKAGRHLRRRDRATSSTAATSPRGRSRTGTRRRSATIFTEQRASRTRWRSWSPRSAREPDGDQIYRITFDGSVADEPGFVAFGGQADQVAAALKERFTDGMSLTEALGAALDALAGPGRRVHPASAASTNSAPAGAERRPARGRDPGPRPRAPHIPSPARPAPRGTARGKPRRRGRRGAVRPGQRARPR